jgi:prolyl oligopeptidase
MLRTSLAVPLLALAACSSAPTPVQTVTTQEPLPSPDAAPTAPPEPEGPAYLARRGDDADDLHGTRVPDPYRWLEDNKSAEVRAWDDEQTARYEAAVDALPQRAHLAARFDHLWRYDDESVPWPCYKGKRETFWSKKKEQDKWVVHLREKPGAKARVILDPNTWAETETLDDASFSDDCGLLAYGKATAGNEDPVFRVLDVTTGKELPDTLAGWRQGGASWLPDNSGFYYSAQPKKGEVADGDEFHFQRVYFHQLGTDGAKDPIVFEDKEHREHFHGASVSEDGRWLLLTRSKFYETEVYLQDLKKKTAPVPVVTGFGHEYYAQILGDQILIQTNWEAPKRRVMVASVKKPGREHWKEIVPEGDELIEYVSAAAGHIYVHSLKDASTRIVVYKLDGKKVREVKLPGIGSAGAGGYWSKKEVRLSFSSFASPTILYRYDLKKDGLKEIWRSPVDFDPSNIATEQVWVTSKDGTKVPMFLVHAKDAPTDGSVPYLLTGYGGFNVTMTPYFSTVYGVWIESGGGVAIPNLRGGGEYGEAWHQAGMKEKKQNVFDDFIASAEWLIANGRTQADRLAIEGGSNGGLLVAAAVTQRPELFRAVACHVPLTDMVRYHKFGLASIWAEEYGSSDDASMFAALFLYSPYHRIARGTDYPAVLVTGSDNDARVDPAHARKFAAALQWADADHGDEDPIYLSLQRDSGHGGGVTIATQVEQQSRIMAFLMQQLGMSTP